MLSIRPIKEFATTKLDRDSLLKRVLAAEPDSIPVEEFVAKLGIYLFLLREEVSR